MTGNEVKAEVGSSNGNEDITSDEEEVVNDDEDSDDEEEVGNYDEYSSNILVEETDTVAIGERTE